MDIDNTFLPVAVELIDKVFPTEIRYLRSEAPVYDPATGEVVTNETLFLIKAGVLSRGRLEAGGVAETYELRLWIQHSASGLPHLPTTADRIQYDNISWYVINIDPTYSSKGLIASKITARNQ